MIGGEVDTYQWETILRSVSAHRSYRHVFHEQLPARNVADFLILQARDAALAALLLRLAARHDRRPVARTTASALPSAELIARDTRRCCRAERWTTIFQQGLHEFLTDFIARNNRVTEALSADYNFG